MLVPNRQSSMEQGTHLLGRNMVIQLKNKLQRTRMGSVKPQWPIAVLMAVLLVSGIAFGQNQLPVELEVTILLRALPYDRNLKQRAENGIHIAVVTENNDQAGTETAIAFREAGTNGVSGLAVEATVVSFESTAQLMELIDEAGFNVLYIHPSAETALSSIQEVAQSKKILSVGGTLAIVEKGASIGVYVQGDLPKLVVNINTSRLEGLDFSAELLGISTVIR